MPALMKRIAIATQRVGYSIIVLMVLLMMLLMIMGLMVMIMSSFQVLFLLECTILPKEDIQLNTRVTIDDQNDKKATIEICPKIIITMTKIKKINIWQRCKLDLWSYMQVFHWPKDMAAVFDLAKTRIGNKRDQVIYSILCNIIL